MEESEACKTYEHAGVRCDPVPNDFCFLHIKGLLGPCEVCEQACHLTTHER
jgi:hypothetical protein